MLDRAVVTLHLEKRLILIHGSLPYKAAALAIILQILDRILFN